MRIYSKHTRRNIRYYLRVMTQDLQTIDMYTLAMAAAALLVLFLTETNMTSFIRFAAFVLTMAILVAPDAARILGGSGIIPIR